MVFLSEVAKMPGGGPLRAELSEAIEAQDDERISAIEALRVLQEVAHEVDVAITSGSSVTSHLAAKQPVRRKLHRGFLQPPYCRNRHLNSLNTRWKTLRLCSNACTRKTVLYEMIGRGLCSLCSTNCLTVITTGNRDSVTNIPQAVK